MTETGSIMGTAQYLSPEQAQGQAVTATSDVYSIGVMLYEMLTGRLPFDGDSAVSIALKHLNEQPPPMSTPGNEIETNLEQVILGALAKDPATRWQSADDFAAALEACRPWVEAQQGSVAPPLDATQVFAALPVGVGGDPDAAAGPPDERDPEAERRRRRRRWFWVALAALGAALVAVMAFAFTRPEEVTVPEGRGSPARRCARTARARRLRERRRGARALARRGRPGAAPGTRRGRARAGRRPRHARRLERPGRHDRAVRSRTATGTRSQGARQGRPEVHRRSAAVRLREEGRHDRHLAQGGRADRSRNARPAVHQLRPARA